MLYIDVLFLINILANYLLLLVTARVCSICAPRYRLALGALLGAFYAVAAVLPGMGFLSNVFIKLAVGAAMLLTAFGGQDRLLRPALVFMGAAAGFAGAVLAATLISGNNAAAGIFRRPTVYVLLGVFAGAYIVYSIAFRRAARAEGEISRIELRLGERQTRLSALRDTGNSLSDPLTGKKVLITDFCRVAGLFPPNVRALMRSERCRDPVAAVELLNKAGCGCRFRLVSYRAVGVEGGLLPAFSPDGMSIDGKREDSYLIALSPNTVGDGGPYSALIGAA